MACEIRRPEHAKAVLGNVQKTQSVNNRKSDPLFLAFYPESVCLHENQEKMDKNVVCRGLSG